MGYFYRLVRHAVISRCQIRKTFSLLLSKRYAKSTQTRTFFHGQRSWPMPDSADPLYGWKLSEVLQEPHPAKHDIYGLLYLHIRKYLLKFCEKLRTLKLDVSLFCMDALDLPNRIENLDDKRRYDRIEVCLLATPITQESRQGLRDVSSLRISPTAHT
jgi:hypothetical protein